MKEIITNEFIRYKDGFIDGKWELIEAFQLGKIIDLNKDEEDLVDYWYNLGYEDGIQYFANLLDEDKYIDLDKINIVSTVKENFCNRVIQYNEVNQESGKQIPIGKFKL